MDRIHARLLLISGLLAIFVATMLFLQWQEVRIAGGPETATPGSVSLGPGDFDYGPQAWRPYAVPLPIDPDGDRNALWYLAFVPLNGTPDGPGPFTGLGEAVAVHYRVSSLSGTMAFAVYGTASGQERGWTNRPTGFRPSGFYVAGTVIPADDQLDARVLPDGMPVEVSAVSAGGLPGECVGLTFLRNGSGLDSLHLTRDLVERKGQVTRTSVPEGTFYIISTGGGHIERTLLLVAVDRPQPLSFQLNLESWTLDIEGGAGA